MSIAISLVLNRALNLKAAIVKHGTITRNQEHRAGFIIPGLSPVFDAVISPNPCK